MKSWIVGLALFCSASAGAVTTTEGWEKPVLEATMVEVDGISATEENRREYRLTMTQKEDSETATGFTLVSGRYRLTFTDVDVSKEGCGSTEYRAKVEDQVVMTLTDHSTRLCEDYRPHQWEAVLSDAQTMQPVRYLVGTPEAVFTIQNDLR